MKKDEREHWRKRKNMSKVKERKKDGKK